VHRNLHHSGERKKASREKGSALKKSSKRKEGKASLLDRKRGGSGKEERVMGEDLEEKGKKRVKYFVS